jgi:hypothetical protein
MKKVFLIVVLLISLFSTSIAAPPDEGIFSTANYFPADTMFFFAIRTDEAYIDEIDAIINNAVSGAPFLQDMPITTLRGALEEGLEQADFDLDDVYTWLGDYFALGVTNITTNDSDLNGYAVLQITDREAAEAFIIEEGAGIGFEQSEEGGFTSFTDRTGARILVGDDVMLLLSSEVARNPLVTREARLDSTAPYQTAIETLPADQYNFALYISSLAELGESSGSDLEAAGIDPDTIGAFALGGTILDKYSLTLDLVQLPGEENEITEVERIDPAFQSYIPSDSSAFIHGTDYTSQYNASIEILEQTAETSGTPNPTEQIEEALGSIGIDLQEDILSWTTGDYALFARTDLLGGIEAAMESDLPTVPENLSDFFDFGIVLEATDAERAETFTTKITTLLTAASSEAEEVEVTEEEIAGSEVTIFTITAPINMNDNVELQFVIGSNDEVFFAGTRNAAEVVFAGEGGLDENEGFQQANAYILEDPTTLWYADAEGLTTVTVIPFLTLVGPAIGNIFDNIVDDLSAPQALYPQPMTVQNEDETQQVIEGLEYLNRLIGSSSISATVNEDGATITRFVFSFNAQ